MPTHLAAGTSTGLIRKRNEDAAYVGRWLCAVADGMGGHVAGNVASAAVVEALCQFDVRVASSGQLLETLGHAVSAANDQLAARIEADSSLAGMGTTLTAMLWSGRSVAVANIGDSRAYLLRRGTLRQITENHVMGNLVARPSPAQISAILVRYLDGRPGRSPDLTLRTVLPGDRYLICSDGLTGVVDALVIRDVLTSVEDADQVVADLIRLAHDAGAPDNVTVVVADVPGDTWTAPEHGPRVLGSAVGLAAAS
jgi:protein phosphatase